MSKEEILKIEALIDNAFNDNELLQLGFTRAIWTLLSVVEDHHFKVRVYRPLETHELDIYIDGLMNSLSYPIRACHNLETKDYKKIIRKLVDLDYSAAHDWISRAEEYTHFCSIFPLYHNSQIDIEIKKNKLIPTDWSSLDLSYEVYDRFVKQRSPDEDIDSDPNAVVDDIIANTKITKNGYSLNFSPKLVKILTDHLKPTQDIRFSLPQNWEFKHFSIREFKEIFCTIQAMMYGWFLARQIAAQRGTEALAYNNALWTPGKTELLNRLVRYTGVVPEKVSTILEYLTFGNVGVRYPDIAIQPIVDLRNGEYAISSFVWANVNCERNLCVLLNQIKSERDIYSRLVHEKEDALRNEIIYKLDSLGYDYRYGQVDNTDLDLAIIDRIGRKCLTVELKWFIEPAEIREVIQRSDEIKKGIRQAKVIQEQFYTENERLVHDVLDIDSGYEFLSIVGSVNFIGNLNAQDDAVPVIKVWHLVSEILSKNDLGSVMSWLSNREYLPTKNLEFEIIKVPIASGEWESEWYGIKHA